METQTQLRWQPLKIIVWHNIMWARYKAGVFSALYEQARASNVDLIFYQIAETDNDRMALSPVDKSWHSYPYTLLFKGAYSSIPRLKLIRELAECARKDSADLTILTGYERPEVWLQAAILFARRQKFALFSDSTIFDKPQSFLKGMAKRLLFGLSSGIFCYGQRAAEYVSHYGVPPEKIFIRRQAAALPRDYSPSSILERRIHRASKPETPRYLYVGRLSPEKSLDKLLTAFKQVLDHYPQATLALVGKGPQEDELKQLADKLGITARVDFAGAKFDDALVDEYLRATCFVLPSYSEPWGLVVNESLSYGCPVIVSNRCGCAPELVAEGSTGHIFDWSDPSDLKAKLMRAPEAFKNISIVTRACLDQLSAFTPENAARGILEGTIRICTSAH